MLFIEKYFIFCKFFSFNSINMLSVLITYLVLYFMFFFNTCLEKKSKLFCIVELTKLLVI